VPERPSTADLPLTQLGSDAPSITPARGEPTAATLSLAAHGLLDAPVQSRFDRYAELARTIWDAPISTVTMIDRDRAYFTSCVGLDLTDMAADQTFCSSVVHASAPVVVPDAFDDPAYRDLPAVAGEPHIRFYAGHPVRDRWSTVLGTVCIYDTRPREFTDHDAAVLAQLARCVEDELDTTSDRDRAGQVQRALQPRDVQPVAGYSFAARSVPTALVAGDALDHVQWDTGHYFLVADVMGKGTAAAILMASVRTALRARVADLATGIADDLGQVVGAARDLVQHDLEAAGSFVTGFVAWADPSSGRLRYVDAGHGLTVLVHPDGRWTSIGSDDLPLGVDATIGWTERVLDTEEGDTLVCFSDGVLDVLPGAEADPGRAVAELVLRSDGPDDVVRRVGRLAHSVPTRDDVTILVVRREAAGA
jgi:hypothetical protein